MLRIAAGLTLCALLMAPSLHARTLEEIKKSGTLKVACDGASPPFNFYQGRELVGFEVDLVKELATQLGVKVEITSKPFSALLIGLNQNHYDLIGTSFAQTEARAKVMDFLVPHYCLDAVMVSKSGGAKKISELEGKTAVIPVGTMYLDELKKTVHFKAIKTVPTELDGLHALLAGGPDLVWVTEEMIAVESVKANQKAGIQIGEKVSDLIDSMVVAKGNKDLKDEANRIFKVFLKDGTYKRLSLKYFGKDIRCQNLP